MRTYLDFEKPVAEVEAKIEELRAVGDPADSQAISEEISRLEEVLMPLLERSQRMMARSIGHLEARRGKTGKTSPTDGQAGQMKRGLRRHE